MPARNDTFSIYEDDLQVGAYKALFANVFEDHGQGTDPAGAAITHINGVALTADTTDFVYLTFASGADLYIGTGGSSFLDVGPGDFKFYFGDRYDYLPAGASKTETLTYTISDGGVSSTATVRITIKGIDSDDLFRGSEAGDAINAGIGNDKVFAYGGNDTVHGGVGDDNVQGGAGNDRLYGDAGFDTLEGGAGRDIIYGGLNQDSLIGGADADRFVFTSINDSRSGHFDVIQDLSRKQGDRVDLKEIDANTKLAADQAFKFIGDAGFTNHAGELRYLNMGNAVLVQGDVNGDGTADLELMLNKIVAAKASDFIL